MNVFYLPSIGIFDLNYDGGMLEDFTGEPSQQTKTERDGLVPQQHIKEIVNLRTEKKPKDPKSQSIKKTISKTKDDETVTPSISKSSTSTASSQQGRGDTTPSAGKIAGLNCDRFGGPSEEIAAEMVYWRDIPSDSHFASPYASYGEEVKYLTFEPDEGGFNNIRMSMETATALAHAMGRILVLPPEQKIYLLGSDHRKENNRFTFKKFFPFDAISEEHKAVEVISMEEFLEREAMAGKMKDKEGTIVFPPNNQTVFEGNRRGGEKLWKWLRKVTVASMCDFSKGPYVFPKTPGPEGAKEAKELYKNMDLDKQNHRLSNEYIDNPTPVDAPATDRLKEMLSFRKNICLYDDQMQNAKVVHFMGDNDSGARLLVHFYAFLFFEDWTQDLWTKRYVRDHLRYIDEIQCAAAKIVAAVREQAIANGDPEGLYESMHVRRGDFQYKQTRIEAEQIYENIKELFPANSTVFIATDERDKAFFDPLRRHYNLLFLDDFLGLTPEINKNYYGMLDQRIASRGRTFAGAFYSTFTGYINRMRGYHSQKNKLPGYLEGKLNSYFYVPKEHQNDMSVYSSLKGPLWGREFPVSWRDIDHDLDPSQFFA